MRKTLLVAFAVIASCLLIASLSSAVESEQPEVVYGYGVDVTPDAEYDDFVRCGLNLYRLDGEDEFGAWPQLRVPTGDVVSMIVQTAEGVEFEFRCFVAEDKSSVSYAIDGRRGKELVVSHMGSVRFN